MKRIAASLMLGAWLCSSAGCSHLLETRTITAFTESLQEADFDKLRAMSSADFKDSVLRRSDALDAIQQLNLPKGEAKVVTVKDNGEDEKQVTVEIGEQKKKVLFLLSRDAQTNKWVVDDIKVKRKLKPGQENKTVAEQMDLLLSIREFLDAWESGERAAVLERSTPAFGQLLSELPPGCLKKLTRELGGDVGAKSGLRPQVEGHHDVAVAKLNRKAGEMLVTMKLVDGRWKADDVHVQQKRQGDSVPSVRKLATAMMATIAFYEGYQDANKEALAGVCTPKFFRSCLESADLSTIKLPEQVVRDGQFDIRLQSTHALAILKSDSEIVQISLLQEVKDEPELDVLPVYRVEDVSFFELNGSQEKRMSALFTSHAVMHIFSEALAAGDVKTLQLTSTHNFNMRVWNRLDAAQLAQMPIEQIEAVPPRVLDIAFKGPVTEITVNQGQTPLTYVLRDQAGKLLVDEVLFPALDRPGEIKTTLELMIPIRNFAAGLQTGDPKSVRQVSSREFNKIVWNQTEAVPRLPEAPAGFLGAPLKKIQLAPDRAIVTLGDEQWGAKVFLVKEAEQYVVDDVIMISGLEQHQRIGLKQRVRAQLANGNAPRDLAPAGSALLE